MTIFLSLDTVLVWVISIMIFYYFIVQVLATLAYISRGNLKRAKNAEIAPKQTLRGWLLHRVD